VQADELEKERAHLAEARRALAAMRDRTRTLDSSAAGDWVSQIALESAMYRRMRALEDDPTVPLFFASLSTAPAAGSPWGCDSAAGSGSTTGR
jgi:hypothetical protein